jgi:uncharacterized membrane protein
MAFCAKCGATVAEGTAFCGSCGAPVTGGAATGTSTAAPSSGMASNIAGMLAYFTFIPAIIFLVLQPYNKDQYVRFHAFQSLFFNVAWIVAWIAMVILGMILGTIPVLGLIIHLVLDLALFIGGFVLWLILVIKAYGNQKFHLPVIGNMAEEQAAK